jgi:hypothetical protein
MLMPFQYMSLLGLKALAGVTDTNRPAKFKYFAIVSVTAGDLPASPPLPPVPSGEGREILDGPTGWAPATISLLKMASGSDSPEAGDSFQSQ